MIRVVIADDQPLIRAGLRAILDGTPGLTVVAEVEDGQGAVLAARELAPEVVLMDLRMPGMDGVDATRAIRVDPRLGATQVLVLTTFDGDTELVAALRAGAAGFLGKSAGPDELVAAVEAVASGRAALSAAALRTAMSDASTRANRHVPDEGLMNRVDTLTPRERDVVIAAAAGADNFAIATKLHISHFTVKTHLNRAMTKLGVRTRAHLVAAAHRVGLVS